MLRGRCSWVISERPTPSPTLLFLATSHPPLATVLLTPLFPLDTQKQGGGGYFLASSCRLSVVDYELPFSPNSLVFSRHSNHILNYMTNNIVGAPTYCKWLTTGARTQVKDSTVPPNSLGLELPPPKKGETLWFKDV